MNGSGKKGSYSNQRKYQQSILPQFNADSQRSVATQGPGGKLQARKNNPADDSVNLFNVRLSSNAYDETERSEREKNEFSSKQISKDKENESSNYQGSQHDSVQEFRDGKLVLNQLSEPSSGARYEQFKRSASHTPTHFNNNRPDGLNGLEISHEMRSAS